ncbi:hypothetical protein CGLO_18181 [Colletotrichum gloeosporioides Cg-14]|uniref:Uncharacterized protein n=1 Tax=Colletotrichum gloeosporioides (strain Cg-14) TaxID=1237896 RepID=T0JII3_COLGC|nr:hypothetical protein CGLO_18181 [Colletotrichum gloeosporioides Cg-14]
MDNPVFTASKDERSVTYNSRCY